MGRGFQAKGGNAGEKQRTEEGEGGVEREEGREREHELTSPRELHFHLVGPSCPGVPECLIQQDLVA